MGSRPCTSQVQLVADTSLEANIEGRGKWVNLQRSVRTRTTEWGRGGTRWVNILETNTETESEGSRQRNNHTGQRGIVKTQKQPQPIEKEELRQRNNHKRQRGMNESRHRIKHKR